MYWKQYKIVISVDTFCGFVRFLCCGSVWKSQEKVMEFCLESGNPVYMYLAISNLFHFLCFLQLLAQAISRTMTMSAEQVIKNDDGTEVRLFNLDYLVVCLINLYMWIIFVLQNKKYMVKWANWNSTVN